MAYYLQEIAIAFISLCHNIKVNYYNDNDNYIGYILCTQHDHTIFQTPMISNAIGYYTRLNLFIYLITRGSILCQFFLLNQAGKSLNVKFRNISARMGLREIGPAICSPERFLCGSYIWRIVIRMDSGSLRQDTSPGGSQRRRLRGWCGDHLFPEFCAICNLQVFCRIRLR